LIITFLSLVSVARPGEPARESGRSCATPLTVCRRRGF
jgi:hypothetical protein